MCTVRRNNTCSRSDHFQGTGLVARQVRVGHIGNDICRQIGRSAVQIQEDAVLLNSCRVANRRSGDRQGSLGTVIEDSTDAVARSGQEVSTVVLDHRVQDRCSNLSIQTCRVDLDPVSTAARNRARRAGVVLNVQCQLASIIHREQRSGRAAAISDCSGQADCGA